MFMVSQPQADVLGRAPLEPPAEWALDSQQGVIPQRIMPATDVEKGWIQEILDGTFKAKATRDRRLGALPERLVVVSALRSEHPALWDRFANRRADVVERCRGRARGRAIVPKTMAACPGLAARCNHLGNPANEAYLLHGSNPTSAQSILATSFTVDLAGAAVGSMFGPGIYMAESSTKADEYARDENTGGAFDGLFALLICRVILGHSFVTEKQGNFAGKCTSGQFDSVLGDREKAVGTFREFILFDAASIYPEYVAFYRREYPDGIDPSVSVRSLGATGGSSTLGGRVPSQRHVDLSLQPKASAPEALSVASPPPAQPLPGQPIGAATRTLQVQLPPGASPGDTLDVPAPWGKNVRCVVPAGVQPGHVLTLQVPV